MYDKNLFNIFLNRNSKDIKPYQVQIDALEGLKRTRSNGKNSGLIVLATGLGKTFLSGFDIIKTTKIKLRETDDELDNLRQRSLGREQQLRRKLQDEIKSM